MNKRLIAALMVLILLVPFIFGGCNQKEKIPIGEGFEIYLTRYNFPPAKLNESIYYDIDDKAHLEFDLEDEPIINMNDIILFTFGDFSPPRFTLTSEAYKRLMKLKVPTSGLSFVGCVDKVPIYSGAFWTPISSQSFDGITIILPQPPREYREANTIDITAGYPSDHFFRGRYFVGDARITKSLHKAGKLLEYRITL